MLLLAAWALAAAGANLLGMLREWREGPGDLMGGSTWGRRVQGLLADLPPGGVIGYISEKDLPGAATDPGDSLEEMLLTQYYLAPRILVPGAEREWVIANFGQTPVDLDDIERRLGLRLVHSYEYGIYLFQRVAP